MWLFPPKTQQVQDLLFLVKEHARTEQGKEVDWVGGTWISAAPSMAGWKGAVADLWRSSRSPWSKQHPLLHRRTGPDRLPDMNTLAVKKCCRLQLRPETDFVLNERQLIVFGFSSMFTLLIWPSLYGRSFDVVIASEFGNFFTRCHCLDCIAKQVQLKQRALTQIPVNVGTCWPIYACWLCAPACCDLFLNACCQANIWVYLENAS